MLIETLLYTVLCWGILERAQGIQVAMATQGEAHLSIFQDLGDQFFHCSLFFRMESESVPFVQITEL